jgi:replicative DNA helicase
MAKLDLDLFEKIIIQQCLKKDSNYVANIIDYLDKDLFKNNDIANIINIIKDFYIERSSIPTLTELAARITTSSLKESLQTVVGFIKKLDSEYNEDELIANTETFIKQRKFGKLMETTIDKKVSEKEYSIEEFQAESEKIHSICLIDDLGLDYFEDQHRIKEYLQKKDNLLSTGYKGLDEAFGGGFQAEGKAIYDIGGETNVGKSIFLANIVVNVLMQNKKVVIISPEMSEMRYAKRISGILTGIAINTLADNIENFDEKVDEFVKKYESRLIIKEVPTKGVSAKNILGYLLKLKNRKGFIPNLICIDGHALLKPSINQGSTHANIQYIVQECRGISYVFPAPVLTVAQLNRTAHKTNNPGLDSLSGSWDSIADLDGHVNIWQTDEDREANIIRFGGKKARDGAKGAEGFLTIDYDTLKLTEEDDMMAYADNNNDQRSINNILNFDKLVGDS